MRSGTIRPDMAAFFLAAEVISVAHVEIGLRGDDGIPAAGHSTKDRAFAATKIARRSRWFTQSIPACSAVALARLRPRPAIPATISNRRSEPCGGGEIERSVIV